MDSMPPATTKAASPRRMSRSAMPIAVSPDRHTLLMVVAGTVMGIPALTAAWRLVICPVPACKT
jgi:hypothetical protein